MPFNFFGSVLQCSPPINSNDQIQNNNAKNKLLHITLGCQ